MAKETDLPRDFARTPPSKVCFGDKLSALCAMELAQTQGNPGILSAMIERLANALGFTIAIGGRGDSESTNNLLEGTVSYLYETAASHTKMGGFIEAAKRK